MALATATLELRKPIIDFMEKAALSGNLMVTAREIIQELHPSRDAFHKALGGLVSERVLVEYHKPNTTYYSLQVIVDRIPDILGVATS